MIQTKEKVTHNDKTYEPGDVIEKINNEQAQRLVDVGAAVFIPKMVQQIPELNESETTPDLEPIPTPNPEPEPDLNPVPEQPQQLIGKEELDEIDYHDLKSISKDVGVDYSGNISKENLIKAIIEQDKVKEVLEQTEVDE